MASRRPYELIYDSAVIGHLRPIPRRDHRLLRDTIAEQLRFEPLVETRHRKPLTSPGISDANWELRCGPRNRFRIFYRVVEDTRQVHILAIGIKERERLFIGGEEIA
jgi:mRNA-degrading endonuclease RelE of RelBE toxin-antitoxin system